MVLKHILLFVAQFSIFLFATVHVHAVFTLTCAAGIALYWFLLYCISLQTSAGKVNLADLEAPFAYRVRLRSHSPDAPFAEFQSAVFRAAPPRTQPQPPAQLPPQSAPHDALASATTSAPARTHAHLHTDS